MFKTCFFSCFLCKLTHPPVQDGTLGVIFVPSSSPTTNKYPSPFYSKSLVPLNFHFHVTLIATISVQFYFDSYLKYINTFISGLSTVEMCSSTHALLCNKSDICKTQF